MSNIEYPDARRENQIDVFHGKEVPDPYRWLEDLNSEETLMFIEKQNECSRKFMDDYPKREEIRSALKDMWDFPKSSVFYRHGNKYYRFTNTGLQNQSILYAQSSLSDNLEIFFNPNLLSEDGTISLHSYSFSEDGKIFAYSLSENDSDWVTIKFRDCDTGDDYFEDLKNVKFSSMAWSPNNLGIFYSRYPNRVDTQTSSEQFLHQKLYYHTVGTSQEEDVLSVEFPDEPDQRIGAEITDCGKWLILSLHKGCKNNLVYVADMEEQNEDYSNLKIVPVVTEYEADFDYVTNDGIIGIFRTNYNSPNYSLMRIPLARCFKTGWLPLLPEHENYILDWAAPINNNMLIVCYINNVSHMVTLYTDTGVFIQDLITEKGMITGFAGKKNHTECFFRFTSFFTPANIYHVDFTLDKIEAKIIEVTYIDGFIPTDYRVDQIFYPAEDGTKIPMYILQKANVERNSQRACLLYGYGGFNVSVLPTFSVARIAFISKFDGMVAIPNIRGGGEYGERWHNAGRLLNKQNSFTDFQLAMKYLVREGYTSVSKLAIQGGSNGGLLVSTCMNQARDLFQAAIAQVPVTDMLRYHKHTIGYAWTSDYGCATEEAHFHNLMTYSPLHNVKSIKGKPYPPILVLTADHDDRVVPSHSFKFVATLQSESKDGASGPFLLYVDTKSGHGCGKPTSKQINEWVDIFSFLAQTLQLEIQK